MLTSPAPTTWPPPVRELYVHKLIEFYATQLGLYRWEFTVEFKESIKERASCIAQPEYREAVLSFNMVSIEDAELPRFVRHELVHCIMNQLSAVAAQLAGRDRDRREWIRQAEERVTTDLEVAPLWDTVVPTFTPADCAAELNLVSP